MDTAGAAPDPSVPTTAMESAAAAPSSLLLLAIDNPVDEKDCMDIDRPNKKAGSGGEADIALKHDIVERPTKTPSLAPVVIHDPAEMLQHSVEAVDTVLASDDKTRHCDRISNGADLCSTQVGFEASVINNGEAIEPTSNKDCTACEDNSRDIRVEKSSKSLDSAENKKECDLSEKDLFSSLVAAADFAGIKTDDRKDEADTGYSQPRTNSSYSSSRSDGGDDGDTNENIYNHDSDADSHQDDTDRSTASSTTHASSRSSKSQNSRATSASYSSSSSRGSLVSECDWDEHDRDLFIRFFKQFNTKWSEYPVCYRYRKTAYECQQYYECGHYDDYLSYVHGEGISKNNSLKLTSSRGGVMGTTAKFGQVLTFDGKRQKEYENENREQPSIERPRQKISLHRASKTAYKDPGGTSFGLIGRGMRVCFKDTSAMGVAACKKLNAMEPPPPRRPTKTDSSEYDSSSLRQYDRHSSQRVVERHRSTGSFASYDGSNRSRRSNAWSDKERIALKRIISEIGTSDWDRVGLQMPTDRSATACQRYYYRHFRELVGLETDLARRGSATPSDEVVDQDSDSEEQYAPPSESVAVASKRGPGGNALSWSNKEKNAFHKAFLQSRPGSRDWQEIASRVGRSVAACIHFKYRNYPKYLEELNGAEALDEEEEEDFGSDDDESGISSSDEDSDANDNSQSGELLKTSLWDMEEKLAFHEGVKKYGNNFKKIALHIPGQQRTANACKIFYYRYYKNNAEKILESLKDIPTSSELVNWTSAEMMCLAWAVNKYKGYEGDFWQLVALELPGRSPRACEEHYRRNQNEIDDFIMSETKTLSDYDKNRYSRPYSSWTPEEKARLLKYVRKYGMDWRKIASKFPGRTMTSVKKCYRRNKRFLKVKGELRKQVLAFGTAWGEKDREDFAKAFKKYGKDWRKISAEMQGRTWEACKAYWKKHIKPKNDPDLIEDAMQHGDFDSVDDSQDQSKTNFNWGQGWVKRDRDLFHEAFQKYGRKWTKVAECIPGRTDKSCLAYYHRYYKTGRTPCLNEDSDDERTSNSMKDRFVKATDSVNSSVSSQVQRAPWSPGDVDILFYAVDNYGEDDWETVAAFLPGKSAAECKEEYEADKEQYRRRGAAPRRPQAADAQASSHSVKNISSTRRQPSADLPSSPPNTQSGSDSDVKQKVAPKKCSPWSFEEKKMLFDAVQRYGKNWYKIETLLPGRSWKSCERCYVYYIDTWKVDKKRHKSSDRSIVVNTKKRRLLDDRDRNMLAADDGISDDDLKQNVESWDNTGTEAVIEDKDKTSPIVGDEIDASQKTTVAPKELKIPEEEAMSALEETRNSTGEPTKSLLEVTATRLEVTGVEEGTADSKDTSSDSKQNTKPLQETSALKEEASTTQVEITPAPKEDITVSLKARVDEEKIITDSQEAKTNTEVPKTAITGRKNVWTDDEKELLFQTVSEIGVKSGWDAIAAKLPGRTAKACEVFFYSQRRLGQQTQLDDSHSTSDPSDANRREPEVNTSSSLSKDHATPQKQKDNEQQTLSSLTAVKKKVVGRTYEETFQMEISAIGSKRKRKPIHTFTSSVPEHTSSDGRSKKSRTHSDRPRKSSTTAKKLGTWTEEEEQKFHELYQKNKQLKGALRWQTIASSLTGKSSSACSSYYYDHYRHRPDVD